MANQQNPMGDFGAMAEQTMEQARRAIDEYFSFLLKTISSYPTGGTEFGEKVKSYAESNLAATHEFVKRVVQTKDVQDLARLQTEFMQDQFQKFGATITKSRRSFYQSGDGRGKHGKNADEH